MNVIFFFFFPSSSSPNKLLLYSLTFPNLSEITWSTFSINCLVSLSSAYPSLRLIWFNDITSKDKLDIVFNKFLLRAKANSPLAARLTRIMSSVSLILALRILMILWYCSWIQEISFSVSLFTVFSYPYLYVNLNRTLLTFARERMPFLGDYDGISHPSSNLTPLLDVYHSYFARAASKPFSVSHVQRIFYWRLLADFPFGIVLSWVLVWLLLILV